MDEKKNINLKITINLIQKYFDTKIWNYFTER